MNQIITLLSDWRLRDPYVSMLKGTLYGSFPDAQILDITHYVDKFNVLQTALLMQSGYSSFPEGSIHLMLTNMSLNSTFAPVLLYHDGHYFIGEDNGVFHLMFGQSCPIKGMQLSDNQGNTLAQMISLIKAIEEGSLEQKTKEYVSFKRMFVELPDYSSDIQQVEGHIVYIDAFNNAIPTFPWRCSKKRWATALSQLRLSRRGHGLSPSITHNILCLKKKWCYATMLWG